MIPLVRRGEVAKHRLEKTETAAGDAKVLGCGDDNDGVAVAAANRRVLGEADDEGFELRAALATRRGDWRSAWRDMARMDKDETSEQN
jgi:hypothetical protein